MKFYTKNHRVRPITGSNKKYKEKRIKLHHIEDLASKYSNPEMETMLNMLAEWGENHTLEDQAEDNRVSLGDQAEAFASLAAKGTIVRHEDDWYLTKTGYLEARRINEAGWEAALDKHPEMRGGRQATTR